MLALLAMSTMTLAACKTPAPAPEPTPEPEKPAKQVIDFPSDDAEDTQMADGSTGSPQATGGHDMMMETAALQQDCATLMTWPAEKRAELLDEIGHNMDKDALDMLLGAKCALAGPLQKIADIEDADLRLMPNDTENLYYSSDTKRFFVSCSSANTVAYVVPMTGAGDPTEYFENNRDQFAKAAAMARGMMEDMMGEGTGGSMDHSDTMDDKKMEDTMEEDKPADDAAAMKKAAYTAYTDGVIGNGEESVLFFHATWCPKCKANDGKLNTWYGAGEPTRSAYKIDYDSATELRQKYGITQQDSFVLIDGAGNKVDLVSFPTEAKLKELVGA